MRVKSERVNLEGKLNIRRNILNDARINNIPLDDTSRVPENAQRVLDMTKYVKKKNNNAWQALKKKSFH